jgi:hypothetical protein
MLTPELQRLAQPVENLGALAGLGRLLEAGAGAFPVRCCKRFAAEAQELVSSRGTHRSE